MRFFSLASRRAELPVRSDFAIVQTVKYPTDLL